MKRLLIMIGVVLSVGLVGFLAIQLVPYGHNHTNPPVVREPNWSSPQVRALAQRACFDCHSNETIWPWYSNIAPISWLVQHDTEEGRSRINFSEWGTRRDERDVAQAVQEGKMPDRKYLMTHPDAALSATDKQTLIQGLQALSR